MGFLTELDVFLTNMMSTMPPLADITTVLYLGMAAAGGFIIATLLIYDFSGRYMKKQIDLFEVIRNQIKR